MHKHYIPLAALVALLLLGTLVYQAETQWDRPTDVTVTATITDMQATAAMGDSVNDIWRTQLLDSLKEAYRLVLLDSVQEEISDSIGAALTFRGVKTFAADSTVFDSMAVIGTNGFLKMNALTDTNASHLPIHGYFNFDDSLWYRNEAGNLRNVER